MNHSVADKIDYTGQIVRAGLIGLMAGSDRPTPRNLLPIFRDSTRHSLKAAAIGAGIGMIGCSLLHDQERRLHKIVACGALAFCMDFSWRNRRIGSEMAKSAAHEIEKVRDAHWLERHPIDYA